MQQRFPGSEGGGASPTVARGCATLRLLNTPLRKYTAPDASDPRCGDSRNCEDRPERRFKVAHRPRLHLSRAGGSLFCPHRNSPEITSRCQRGVRVSERPSPHDSEVFMFLSSIRLSAFKHLAREQTGIRSAGRSMLSRSMAACAEVTLFS